MFRNRNKGFTLIELLVVIAIIGILSSVVLASLNSARNKGSDAAVKADVAGIRAAAEVYYDTNSGYGPTTAAFAGACGATPTANSVSADSTVQAQIDDAVAKNGGTDGKCMVSSSAYVIAVPLKSNTANGWCVDSSGNSMQITMSTFTAATDNTCVLANQ